MVFASPLFGSACWFFKKPGFLFTITEILKIPWPSLGEAMREEKTLFSVFPFLVSHLPLICIHSASFFMVKNSWGKTSYVGKCNSKEWLFIACFLWVIWCFKKSYLSCYYFCKKKRGAYKTQLKAVRLVCAAFN